MSATAVTMTLDGTQELLLTLKDLNESLRNRGMRRMLKTGGSVLAREQRKQVPKAVTPGHNNKTVKARIGSSLIGKSRRGPVQGVKAGVGVGKKRISRGDRGGWGNLLGAGSKDRRTKTGASRGKVLPNAFVRRGLNNAGPVAMQKMAETGRKFIESETRKLQRRRARGLSS